MKTDLLFAECFDLFGNNFKATKEAVFERTNIEYDIPTIKVLYKSYLKGLKQKQFEAERKKTK